MMTTHTKSDASALNVNAHMMTGRKSARKRDTWPARRSAIWSAKPSANARSSTVTIGDTSRNSRENGTELTPLVIPAPAQVHLAPAHPALAQVHPATPATDHPHPAPHPSHPAPLAHLAPAVDEAALVESAATIRSTRSYFKSPLLLKQ